MEEDKEFPEKVHKKARYIQDKEGKDRDQAYAIAISSMYEDDKLEEKKKKRKKAGTESSKGSSLRDWFGRRGAKGKKGGWVDCNAPDGKGGYKSCGRSSGEKRKSIPPAALHPAHVKSEVKASLGVKKQREERKDEANRGKN